MSQSSQLSQNSSPADPKLRDVMDIIIKEVMLLMNTSALATIVSFDPITQTASASINYQKTVFLANANNEIIPTNITYPVMLTCPVYFPQGDGGSFTCPVKPGDQAHAKFNDMDMDNWLASAIVGPVATPRLHSFSDAILYVGVNPFKKALSNFDMLRVLMQYQGASVGCSENGVLIKSGGVKLSKALSDFLSAINTFMETIVTNGGSMPSTPITWAALMALATPAITSLATAQSEISEVLE